MTKRLERLMGRITAALLALAALAPSAFAESVQELIDKGLITFSGGVTTTNIDNDVAFIYTSDGKLVLPSYATAWILSVGGGGAGGTTDGNETTKGMPGGGGAGGFVEHQGEMLFGGTYTITVGAGGDAGTDATKSVGDNGDPSSIALDNVVIDKYTALGGGGGGNESAGADGASGGGGSYSRVDGKTKGGAADPSGQGNAGGDGDFVKYGGGGGGAGASGDSAVKAHSGNGGDGRQSRITLSVDDNKSEVPYYAGGGGGSVSSGSYQGDGGAGGGGAGGGGKGGGTAPIPGTPNTGGGGGAGTQAKGGGAGGSGIVIIRLSAALAGDPKKPTAPDPVPTYGGTNVVAVPLSPAYDIEGTWCATNVASYSCTVSLKPGFKWNDNTDDDVTVNWRIDPRSVPVPEGVTFRYDGTNKVAIVSPDPAYAFIGLGTGNNCTNATDAGDYFYLLELKDDANTVWADKVVGQRRIDWSIKPKTVPQPVVYEDLRYNGKQQFAFDPDEFDETICELTDGQIDAVNAAQYEFNLALKNNNYIWLTAEGTETSADYWKVWMIGRADNAITNLTLASWKKGSRANEPKIGALWGVNDRLPYTYATHEDAPEAEWTTEVPTEVGDYWVRAVIPPSDDWFGAERTAKFSIWDNPETLFRDKVEITVTNDAGKAFVDYPLTLTLAEDRPAGFSYARAGSGTSLVFVSESGAMLPYEVLNWNVAGESSVKVYLDELPVGGMTLTMYWCLRDGQGMPAQPDQPAHPAAASDKVSSEWGEVLRDGRKVDSWNPAPTMSPTLWDWDPDHPQAITVNDYALKSGADVKTGFYNIYDPSVTNDFADAGKATNGTYFAVFYNNDRADYEPIEHAIQFIVAGHSPTIRIIGNKGDSGRVLLMNNDKGAGGDTSLAVDYQGWWDRLDRDPSLVSQSTFWEFIGTDDFVTDSLYNLKAGTNCVLWTANRGRRLWQLVNCRHGNTYETGEIKTSPTMSDARNYLPWSSDSSYRITEHRTRTARACEVGQVVMRNALDAAVYSPVYSNGVGTIYFDAVNGWTDAIDKDAYQLTVEVTTNLTADATEVPAADWTAVPMYPVKVKGTTLTAPTAGVNVFNLDIAPGGAKDAFYRIYVPLEKQTAVDPLKPFRFRIRRASVYEDFTAYPDLTALILIDNILVSYPAMWANLSTAGWLDAGRGYQTLGWAGATSVPFPSVSDPRILAQAKGEFYVNDGDPSADPDKFVVGAQMHYRWRYLNQRFDPPQDSKRNVWRTANLNPTDARFTSLEPLVLPGDTGDVEYWFETRFQAPYFAYVDYSGTGVKLDGPDGTPLYTEEKTVLTNKLGAVTKLASTGTDWFFRVRNGASEYEGVSLVSEGALAVTNALELVGDNMWRALVRIPTNVEGTCSFRLKTYRPDGSGTGALVETAWGNASGPLTLTRIPSNGDAAENGGAITFTVDHDANYYEVRFSDRFRTWAVSRAEYQNFNRWNDIAGQAFLAGWSETNGVNDVAMQTRELDMGGWKTFDGANDAWNEIFHLANYKDPGFPRETVFATHVTPAKWNGANLSFVSKELITKDEYESVSDTKSGLAATLCGRSDGMLEFTKSDSPKGLEKVTATARIGQTTSFGTLNYSARDMRKKDYTFLAPVYMSNGEADDNALGTMAVGASASIFAYYRESRGCYEFRLSRDIKGAYLRGVLYKWHKVDGVMTATPLVTSWFGGSDEEKAKLWTNTGDLSSYMMFISVKTSGSSTRVCAGVSTGTTATLIPTDVNIMSSALTYSGLTWTDTDDPHTSGTYGVAAKDCPAAFSRQLHYDGKELTPASAPGGVFTKQAFTFPETAVSDYDDLGDDYWELNGAVEVFSGNDTVLGAYRQIRVPAQTQTLELWLQERLADGTLGDWTKKGERTVSGYAFQTLDYDLYLTGQYNLRLRTGGRNVDVSVGEVRQVQWQAKDIESIDFLADDFIYTQGVVAYDESLKTNAVTLQPSRGLATKAMSVRAPIIDGFGKIAFSYKDVDDFAQILVQVATNRVEYNLAGSDEAYNWSVKEVPLGEPAKAPVWVTVTNFTAAALKGKSEQTVYLGWHNQPDRPMNGVFRIAVPTNVIVAAQNAAAANPRNLNYGRITITGMTVTDEPGLDDRCWRGWNLRGIGSADDSEQRMYLFDTTVVGETGNGLDCALNNSIKGVAKEDREHAASGFPAIYSPTMRSSGGSSGVGTVTFKARLYDGAVQVAPGKVMIYGSRDSIDGPWEKAAEFDITSPVFRDFSWSSSNEVSFTAVKLEVHVPSAKTLTETTDRVILDEIVIGERVEPTLGFTYARPFRMNLMKAEPVEDILSMNEQPLAGENWGVQVQLSLQQLADEIAVERGFKVYFSYFVGKSPWGYEQWKDLAATVRNVPLTWVGEKTNLVFRSVGDTPDSLVPPIDKGGTIVQFQVTAEFYDKAGIRHLKSIDAKDWTQPDWFHPIDLNRDNGGLIDPTRFSPYTVLDTVSPGRAWINEVNWNDGPLSQNGQVDVRTNQFLEICVPSGVNMEGWYVRATDINLDHWILARFGDELPAVKKPTLDAVEGFEFVVLESPETNLAGGIHDAEGNPVAVDGVWSISGPSGTTSSGSLYYQYPYQFELVRPSGIIAHQFVVGGTNTSKRSYAYLYDATNLLANLNAENPSPNRFLAGTDQARQADERSFASLGVVGGNSNAHPAPGDEGTWRERLKFTPGQINEGQVIPKGWYLPPNGTNSWVTLMVLGEYLTQTLGEETAPVLKLVIPQGSTTNVTYRTKPWYEVESLTVNGVTNATHEARGGQDWVYTLSPTGQACTVVATEGYDAGLSKFGVRRDGPYADEIVRWLSGDYGEFSVDDIRNATFLGLWSSATNTPMSLLEMYWLGVPPVVTEEEKASGVANVWWLRGGITEFRPNEYRRIRHYAAGDVEFVNSQLDFKLYVSNAVNPSVVYAPQYLQGEGNRRSNEGGARWTSETLQFLGNLNLAPDPKRAEPGYMPFRTFILDRNSFSGADDPKPFTSVIEILDPFSAESPGYSYGWTKYAETRPSFYFKWALSTNSVPQSVETLRANDTYGE